jgi:hypothetical protein
MGEDRVVIAMPIAKLRFPMLGTLEQRDSCSLTAPRPCVAAVLEPLNNYTKRHQTAHSVTPPV